MARKTSEWEIASDMPGVILGRDSTGNLQIPLTVFGAYIQEKISSIASNTTGAVNFRGAWVSGYDYATNDVVSYGGQVYLMIGTTTLTSTTAPDQDATYWLCLGGQKLIASDLDDLKTDRAFFYSGGATNAPSAAPYGYGMVIMNGTGYGIQLYWSNNGTQFYTRVLNDKTWGSWVLMAETYPHIANMTTTSGDVWLDASTAKEFYVGATGDVNLGIAGWPALASNYVQKIRVELAMGSYTLGFNSTINWIKSDGSLTTTFADLGIVINTSGSNFFDFWSKDGGTTIYGVPVVG